MTNSDLTLVLGGTGKTGRRVARRLSARDRPVRIGSRAGDPPFDWTDRTTWPVSLAGVRTAYLTYQPDLAFPGAAEVAAEISAASGLPVRHVPVTMDEFVAGAVGAGFRPEVAAGLGEVFAVVLDGRNAATTGGVVEALRRPPRDFTEFAAAAWGSR